MKNKLIWLLGLSVVLTACDVDNTLDPIEGEVVPEVALSASGLDFSKYVSVGASFTAGFTDGALFKASQENSFPNLLSKKFAMANGGAFTQPLMKDNYGGLILNGQPVIDPLTGQRLFTERFVFNGESPVPLKSLNPTAMSTTEIAEIQVGPYNNMGVPGIKSYHLDFVGYGALAAFPNSNPYFVRMASSPGKSVLDDAVDQNPTFFTLSEIGGNDVLGYAIAGGDGKDQTGNINAATYGPNDITDPNVFTAKFSKAVTELTKNGAKGVVTTVPYVTSLPYFTTVPHAPLDPSNPSFGSQISTLNNVFGAINGVFTAIGVPERAIVFHTDKASPVVIKDEALPNKTTDIIQALLSSPTFPGFVQSFGLPTDPITLQKVAGLLGSYYGQARQATEKDLLVLPSSTVIGTVNTTSVGFLMSQGLPQQLAGMFSAEGISLPLADKWVLTEDEVSKVKTATDSYNATIDAVAKAKNLAIVDFKAILAQASTTGISTGDFVLTTQLVTGGLVSLDGIHLTARGYAVLANKVLEAIDKAFGSNFTNATNGLVNPGNYPTNYPPTLQ